MEGLQDESIRARDAATDMPARRPLISKVPYNERLRWMRSGGPLPASAELMWQLMTRPCMLPSRSV